MDFREIRKLIDLLYEAGLAEIEVEEAGRKIRVRRESISLPTEKTSAAPTAKVEAPALETEKEDKARGALVRSPIVGTFYRSPSPNADAYSDVGDLVKKGQILCIVEAMKLMNEIESDVEGKIVEICVEDGAAVEYGEPLFRIDPAA